MKINGRTLRRRRALAIGAVGALIAGQMIGATAASAAPDLDGPSAAYGHGLNVEGLGLDIAGAAYAFSEHPGNIGANGDNINVTLLDDLIDLNLGTVSLPLLTPTVGGNGLLYLGDLGLVASRAQSPSGSNSVASSGIINEDGSLNVDTAGGPGFAPAELNVTQLLEQVLGQGAVDTLLNEASIKLGALGSTAQKNGTSLTSQYAVADLQVDLSSPLVGDLVDTVDATLGTILDPLQDLLGPTGTVRNLVGGVVNTIDALPLTNASLNELSLNFAPLTNEVRAALLASPLENTEGSISVNLGDGTIHVDLKQILMDRFNTTDLNSLDPNTEVLDDVTINAILDGVTDALTGAGPNSLISKVVDIVTEGLYNVQLTVDIQAEVSVEVFPLPPAVLVDAPVTVKGSIGGFLGTAGHDAPVVDTSGIDILGIPLGAVLQPIINVLTGLVTSIGSTLDPVVTQVLDDLQPTLMGVVQLLVTDLLDNAVEPLLSEVVQIRINEQPTEEPLNGVGDLGAGSFTVRALAVRVLPNIADVGLELGSSTVEALDVAATIDAPATVRSGDSFAVTGADWPANTDVTLQLRNAANAPIGTAVTATTNATGAFPAGTSYLVPAGTPAAAGYVLTGTAGAVTATDTLAVELTPVITGSDAAAGGNVTVTGNGWIPGATISLELRDADDNVIGTPVTGIVIAADGTLPAGTVYPVPAGTTPGDYTLVGIDTVNSLTDEDTVAIAAAASIAADATVRAGDSLNADGAGWPAGASVSLQLRDASDAPIGAAVTAIANGSGSFTGASYPVPAGTTAGTGFELTATSGTVTATDTVEVTREVRIAGTDAAAGGNVSVSGSGWIPGASVVLELRNGSTVIGAAKTVTIASDGTIPTGTTYAVPGGTPARADYTLVGTDAVNSLTAQDTVEITANAGVNTNAAASASASADATADGDPSAQAAAVAAAYADATSNASAAATADSEAAAQVAGSVDASTTASTTAQTAANAQAAVAAQAAALANADDDVNASASAVADANSSSSANAAATATSSANASSEASTNANAAASASASAQADGDDNAVADAAAQAAAYADATAVASAAADASANAAASASAIVTSTATASANATTAANATAAAAAQAAALANATSNSAADTSATATASATSAASAAAIASSSTDASTQAAANASAAADPTASTNASAAADPAANTNASASAAASAQADSDNNTAAQAAAVAAALANASTTADAAADPNAEAAAAAAARADVEADASATASTNAQTAANASAAVAAQASAQADNSSNTTADTSAAANANTAASASAASTSTSSATASAQAATDADAAADPTANTNASASAAASAQADSDNNAAAQAAAVAAALADASTAADAKADPNAEAAAAAAARADVEADATATASANAQTAANASAAVAAQASAQADNSANTTASASAAANANTAASASAASTATSSAAASATAAANSTASAAADPAASASADADPTGKLGITVKRATLERGQQQTAVGTGFEPGEVVTGLMNSAPLALGTQVADARGEVTFTWTIPASTDLGGHTVTLTGPESGSVIGTFQVVADGLAGTGSDVPAGWLLLGFMLLVLGLGTTLVVRSRRMADVTE